MKHRIRKRFKYARKMLKWLYKSVYFKIGIVYSLLFFIGYMQDFKTIPVKSCSSEIRRVMESRNSRYIPECQIFVSYHGFNDQNVNQFKIYRKGGF